MPSISSPRQMGFATALDDFGAGHAGLGLLAKLRTDVVKLDMELIRGIDASMPRRMIKAICSRRRPRAPPPVTFPRVGMNALRITS